MSLPFAHVAGIPIEEALGALGPVFLVVAGAILAGVRARFRRRGRADQPGSQPSR
jgi:hypothetical protein